MKNEKPRSHFPPKRPPGYVEITPRSGTVETEAQKMPFANKLGYLMREKVGTIALIEKEVSLFEYRFFNEGGDKEGSELCDEVSRGFERDIIDGSEEQLRRLQNLLARLQRINGNIFGDMK